MIPSQTSEYVRGSTICFPDTMGSHHSNDREATLITRCLSDFARDVAAMIETIKHGRLQFTSDEYSAMETASLDLAKTANNIADEVKALGKRRTPAVVAEGQNLLSQVKSAKLELVTSQKPKRQVLFVRNIRIFFNPPEESKLDTPAVQKRKQLTRERCEILRGLSPNKMILWAAAFAPSVGIQMYFRRAHLTSWSNS